MGSCLSVQTPRQTPSRHRDRPRTVDKTVSIPFYSSLTHCLILYVIHVKFIVSGSTSGLSESAKILSLKFSGASESILKFFLIVGN